MSFSGPSKHTGPLHNTFTYSTVIHWDVVLNTLGQISGEKEAQYLCCLGPGRRQTVNKTKQFPGTKAEREQSIIGPGESGEVRLLGGG